MQTSMLPGNRVDLLHDGEACFHAMLRAIEGAEREVLLEMYWFGSDKTGRKFAAALEEKARQGIRVCVSYDSVGSFEADRRMFEHMRGAGCDVQEFNPVRLWPSSVSFAGLNRRDHRKLLLCDGRVGFTGGVNFADPWAPTSAGGQGFRDDAIELEGPIVRAMRAIFLQAFSGALRDRALADPLGSDEPKGESRVRVLTNDLREHRRLIEQAYLHRIRTARERILITNSYFIPSQRVRRALADAVRRGVKVRVLLPVESDVPAVTYATHRLYGTMLARGIELYEWSQSILHAKTAAVDGRWCTVGTHNLDYRSWAYNLEINVAVEDEAVAGRLEARMQRDMDASVRVDAHAWRFRPLGPRILEEVFYRMRRML
ncbi:MAG: phosphatidylserine/phosphatidylglycerophosphate/cardiolipin synthase family protein [Polyangiales bacterium]